MSNSTRRTRSSRRDPLAPVINLAEWRGQQAPTGCKTIRVDRQSFGLGDGDEAFIVRALPIKEAGIRKDDAICFLKTDVFDVRDGDLVAVESFDEPYSYYIGFLRCESLTQWYVDCTRGYETDYFHPNSNSIKVVGRALGKVLDGQKAPLKCYVRPPHEAAKIIEFPTRRVA